MAKKFSKTNDAKSEGMENNNKGKSKKKGKVFREPRHPQTAAEKYEGGARNYNVERDSANDWSWYVPNAQMLRDVASLPYGVPLGTRNSFSVDVYESTLDDYSIPGVMSVNISPTFGWSEDSVSPINVAARNIYTEIRHANSGHANYDSPDLMLYLMAMDSTYSYFNWMKRLYGTLMCYSNQNRYLPMALVEAMGADFSDLLYHLNDLRAFINYYALRCGTTCVPADMSYYWKHEWMYTNVFCDSTNPKAQCYVTRPRAFYTFDYDDDEAGMLKYTPFAQSSNLLFKDIVDFGNALLQPVINNEDFAIMSGDILKAKGDAGVKKLALIPEGYVCVPRFEPTFNYQIQNATLVGEASNEHDDLGAWNLVQSADKGYLIFKPRFKHSSTSDTEVGMTPYFTKKLVSFEHADVKPEETLDATRWTNVAQIGYYGSDKSISYRTIASEVVHSVNVYAWYDDGNDWVLNDFGPYYTAITTVWNFSSGPSGAVAPLENSILATSLISNFGYHPWIEFNGGMINDFDPSNPTYNLVKATGLMGDVGYYTIVDADTLENMARVALFTMFNLTSHVVTG